MDRESRRDDRRRRDDPRDHKPRYERDRSRSPPPRDRRDERRRDRSPPRGPRGPGASNRPDREHQRSGAGAGRERQHSGTPPPSSRRPGIPTGPRQPLDSRFSNPTAAHKGRHAETSKQQDPRGRPDVRMQDAGPPEDEDSEAEMKRIMGFAGFRTTKDTKVPGNERNYGVHKVKKAEYRQYMNRVGGFNRPLSPTRM